MKWSVTFYRCKVCRYTLREFEGQVPMNFMLTCPKCKVRLTKGVLSLSH